MEGLPGPLFIVKKMLYSNIIQYSPLEEVTNQQPLVKVKSNDFFTGDEVILIFLSLRGIQCCPKKDVENSFKGCHLLLEALY